MKFDHLLLSGLVELGKISVEILSHLVCTTVLVAEAMEMTALQASGLRTFEGEKN